MKCSSIFRYFTSSFLIYWHNVHWRLEKKTRGVSRLVKRKEKKNLNNRRGKCKKYFQLKLNIERRRKSNCETCINFCWWIIRDKSCDKVINTRGFSKSTTNYTIKVKSHFDLWVEFFWQHHKQCLIAFFHQNEICK